MYAAHTLAALSGSSVNISVRDAQIILGAVLLNYLLTAIGQGQFFKKAGLPAVIAFIPLYNYWIMREIAAVKQYWFWLTILGVFTFVPQLGFVFIIIAVGAFVYLTVNFLRRYDKGTDQAVLALTLPFIYYPVVGFSKNLRYHYKPIHPPRSMDGAPARSAGTSPPPPRI